MSNTVIARRYAQALHRVGEQEGAIGQIDEDAEVISISLTESRDLRRFFESPIVSREKKKAAIESLFGKRLAELTVRFLVMLVEQNREQLVGGIISAYKNLRDEQLGYVSAEARVASEISREEREKLTRRLEQLSDRKVRLTVTKDPSIIGGAIVRIGDTVYDGSVRRQLEAMSRRLQNQTFLTN